MEKQAKAKAAANMKAGNGKKRTGNAAAESASADNVPELLRKVVAACEVIAARVESVRRTLWRMSEIREYDGKGGEK